MLGTLDQGKGASRSPLGLVIVHGSEAGLWEMINGSPEAVITEMGSRIADLERFTIQSIQREQELRRNEQELRNRVDEMARVVIRNQGGNQAGGGCHRDRNISEYKAVLNLKVLTDDRAGYK